MQQENQETKKHYVNFINGQRGIGIGQSKIACPECQKSRTKNKKDRPFSVNIDSEKIIYNCCPLF